jgi:DNA-directed RNA polymerase subunit RPC12/RpoP
MFTYRCPRCGHRWASAQPNLVCPSCNWFVKVLAKEVTKEQERKKWADFLYDVDPQITDVFTLLGDPSNEALPDEPIKLLVVRPNASQSRPLELDPPLNSGIPFSTVTIEVTPEVLAQIQSNQVPLPHGWTLGARLPRPAFEPGSDW